jgi:hypothetical protein
VGPDEGLLRDVLGVLAMAQDPERHAERQGGALDESGLELAFEPVVEGHEAGEPSGMLMHLRFA